MTIQFLKVNKNQHCGNCSRGCFVSNGNISCGAAAEDKNGLSPVWAERKYSVERVFKLISNDPDAAIEPSGSDCENMHPSDGLNCKVWEAIGSFGENEEWHDVTILGSHYQEQVSRSGKYRYRPRSINLNEHNLMREIGSEDWRPGRPPSARIDNQKAT